MNLSIFANASRIVSSLVLAGLAAVLVLTCTYAPQALAQRPAYPIVQEIHVDGSCRILPAAHALQASEDSAKKKQRPIKDPVVCHIESPHTSQHLEEAIVGHELLRNRIQIAEQEFVLQNIASDPVVFVVQQPVSSGWQVDSDPQPVAIEGTGKSAVAFFKVHAQPGEIVRLHVGERHAIPLKPKVVAASITTPQSSN